ncbi:hypothetical protein [Rhizorhabdus argentea]|uniref:hypothetical protein n=1 Tax=Rhizorhabdus argentea TaxID=1387174 RepID=UPI0030EC13F0
MIPDDFTAKITKVVQGAPEWLRQDLMSKDPVLRTRAEETLSAMIAAALSPAK